MIDWTDDPAGWAAGPWHQSWSYGEAARGLGALPLRARGPWGQVQLLARRQLGLWVATAAHAPALPAEIWRALRLPVRGPRLVIVQPQTEADLRPAGLRQIFTPGATATFDLTQPLDALLAAQHGKWRNRLRAARRDGLTARAGPTPAARLGWLFELEQKQQRRRRYAGLPPDVIARWDQVRRAGERLVLVEVRRRATRVAAMLFVVTGPEALYQIGWQDAPNAHTLALWTAVEHLKAAGVARLDLGGIDTQRAPGLARFKLGSGATPHRLGGTWA